MIRHPKLTHKLVSKRTNLCNVYAVSNDSRGFLPIVPILHRSLYLTMYQFTHKFISFSLQLLYSCGFRVCPYSTQLRTNFPRNFSQFTQMFIWCPSLFPLFMRLTTPRVVFCLSYQFYTEVLPILYRSSPNFRRSLNLTTSQFTHKLYFAVLCLIHKILFLVYKQYIFVF